MNTLSKMSKDQEQWRRAFKSEWDGWWIGHTLREEEDFAREPLEWNLAGSKKVGRPGNRWKKDPGRRVLKAGTQRINQNCNAVFQDMDAGGTTRSTERVLKIKYNEMSEALSRDKYNEWVSRMKQKFIQK